MHGSTLRRSLRLAGHLLAHPTSVPRWLRHGPWSGSSPIDLGVPWFAWGAIDHLDKAIASAANVFEFGSGGSTLFFARRAARVTAVEDHADWAAKVRKRLERDGISNVDLRPIPFDFVSGSAFEESSYLNSLPTTPTYDLIVVDGQDNQSRYRPVCFARAEKSIKPGGMIVLDDAWRYPDVPRMARANQRLIFRGVGPCRPGVTQTDIYCY